MHQDFRCIQDCGNYQGRCHEAPPQRRQTVDHHNFRREVRPETFDGRVTEWDDFIGHFDRVCSWNRWSNEESAMQLAMNIRQPASCHLEGLSQEVLQDYDFLKVTLRRKFAPKERQMAARCEFRNRVRHNNERATDFKVELQRMASKGWSDYSHETKDAMVLEQFLAGIKDGAAKRHIVYGRPSSLQAAVSLLEEYDAFEMSLQREGSSFEKPREVAGVSAMRIDEGLTEQKDSGVLLELGELKAQIEELQSHGHQWGGPGNPPQRRGKNIECYRCGEIGHMSFNCPNKTTKIVQS
jgi:hypothetical protein